MIKEEKVQRIIEDLKANLYDSEDFIWDCVHQVVSKWSRKQLDNYLGIEREEG